MPPKFAAGWHGKGSVAVGSTHPAKFDAATSLVVAAVPTCESPMCGIKTVMNNRIAAHQLTPHKHVPVASIVPDGTDGRGGR